jgi:hypothetical protein
MHFTRHSRSKHPDGSFRLGRVMVPPDRCCSACSVAVRRSFNPTKRRSSVCSVTVRLFLASLVQRQRIGPRSCRREVWCSKRALPFSRFRGFSDSVRLSGVFESQRQGLTPYRPWDIGEMIDSNDPVGEEWFFAIWRPWRPRRLFGKCAGNAV